MDESQNQKQFNGWPIAEQCTLEQALRWIVDRLPPLSRQAEALESYPDPISYDVQNATGRPGILKRYDQAGKTLITKIVRDELRVSATPYVMPGTEASFTPIPVPEQLTSSMWGYGKIDWIASCLNPYPSRHHSHVIFSIRINFSDLERVFHPTEEWVSARSQQGEQSGLDTSSSHEGGPNNPVQPVIINLTRFAREDLKKDRSERARKAAEAKHREDRARAERIRQIWSLGTTYLTRSACAEQEWEGLKFNTYETARKALRGTPDPEPWPAKTHSESRRIRPVDE